MRVLWLVTARSGSRGLPDKNILPLGGRPLLAWRIAAALPLPGEVWLSTDSEAYAALGRSWGAQTPFLRPAALSGDTARSVDVCLHAMEHAQAAGLHFDALGLLQPTSPFAGSQCLQKGLEALHADPRAHAAVAVRRARESSLLIQPDSPRLEVVAQRLHSRTDCRRQALPEEIAPCGAFYIARWDSFLRHPDFYTPATLAVRLADHAALDIDTEEDWALAEFLLTSGRVQPDPTAL